MAWSPAAYVPCEVGACGSTGARTPWNAGQALPTPCPFFGTTFRYQDPGRNSLLTSPPAFSEGLHVSFPWMYHCWVPHQPEGWPRPCRVKTEPRKGGRGPGPGPGVLSVAVGVGALRRQKFLGLGRKRSGKTLWPPCWVHFIGTCVVGMGVGEQ